MTEDLFFREFVRDAEFFEQPKPSIWRRVLFALSAPVYVDGVDVSKWQGAIDFAQLKAGGYEFVIIKSTEGTLTDPYFERNWQEAASAGMLVGFYHFFRSNLTGEAQAGYHLDVIRPAIEQLNGIIPSHADVETSDGVTSAVRISRLNGFLDTVQNNWKQGGTYSSPYLWQQLTANAAMSDWGWVAHWTSGAYAVPTGWDPAKVKVWQYGVSGKYPWCPASVPGVEGACDVDRFLGTKADLLAWAGYEEPAPPPDDCQEQIDLINVRLNQVEADIDNLETQTAQLAAAVSDLTERVAKLEEGGSVPPPASYVMYVVTADKAVARYAADYNDAGRPIMVIWSADGTTAGRVKFENGETFKAHPGVIKADGGAEYVQLFEVPAGAPDLYVELIRIRQV